MPHALFICTGNICRSPFAEYSARTLAEDGGCHDWTFSSRGTHAVVGYPCPKEVVRVANAFGVDVKPHRGAQVEKADILSADLIVVMTHQHALWLRHQWPDLYDERVRFMVDFFPNACHPPEVVDPFGGELYEYRAAFALIYQCIEGFIASARSPSPP